MTGNFRYAAHEYILNRKRDAYYRPFDEIMQDSAESFKISRTATCPGPRLGHNKLCPVRGVDPHAGARRAKRRI